MKEDKEILPLLNSVLPIKIPGIKLDVYIIFY